MTKNIIFCFTGTGNSLKVAKDIAEGNGESEIISMGKPYSLQGAYESIGFVYPVYAGGMPAAVERFIGVLDISTNRNSYFFAVSTSGSGLPGGLPQINRILHNKGGKLSYGGNVKCFSNYVGLYAMKDDVKERPKVQDAQTRLIVTDIQNRVSKQDFKNSSMALLHGIFINILRGKERGFNVGENCNGCGTCNKVCPVANIEMQSGKPTFLHHCEQCMACIQWCPKQAINYKDKTQNRGRYHHPDIKVGDIIKLSEVKPL